MSNWQKISIRKFLNSDISLSRRRIWIIIYRKRTWLWSSKMLSWRRGTKSSMRFWMRLWMEMLGRSVRRSGNIRVGQKVNRERTLVTGLGWKSILSSIKSKPISHSESHKMMMAIQIDNIDLGQGSRWVPVRTQLRSSSSKRRILRWPRKPAS